MVPAFQSAQLSSECFDGACCLAYPVVLWTLKLCVLPMSSISSLNADDGACYPDYPQSDLHSNMGVFKQCGPGCLEAMRSVAAVQFQGFGSIVVRGVWKPCGLLLRCNSRGSEAMQSGAFESHAVQGSSTHCAHVTLLEHVRL
eukprot:1159971-Pelagomonas_calceolata.AAC.2